MYHRFILWLKIKFGDFFMGESPIWIFERSSVRAMVLHQESETLLDDLLNNRIKFIKQARGGWRSAGDLLSIDPTSFELKVAGLNVYYDFQWLPKLAQERLTFAAFRSIGWCCPSDEQVVAIYSNLIKVPYENRS